MGPPGSALFGAPKPPGSNNAVAPEPQTTGIKPGMSAADAAASKLILPQDQAHSSLTRRRSTKSGRTPLASGSPQFTKFDAAMKAKLLAKEKEEKEKAMRDAKDERARELAEFNRGTGATASNIIMPQYKRDEILDCDREVEKPPNSLFIGLGWDEDAQT